MKFDRWDNYQWLGDYDPIPSWGQVYRSGQYIGFPAAAYVKFSSELAALMGNEYDWVHGHFRHWEPLPGKTCAPQVEIDAWFEAKRALNASVVPELQAVEDWFECYKRKKTQMGKDYRKERETFYEEQAKLAGLTIEVLERFDSYRAAIAISKPPTLQSWKILLPKLLAAKRGLARQEAKSRMEAERQNEVERERERALELERELEEEMQREWMAEEWNGFHMSQFGVGIPVSRGGGRINQALMEM